MSSNEEDNYNYSSSCYSYKENSYYSYQAYSSSETKEEDTKRDLPYDPYGEEKIRVLEVNDRAEQAVAATSPTEKPSTVIDWNARFQDLYAEYRESVRSMYEDGRDLAKLKARRALAEKARIN
jgi:hypothetical protein